MKQLVCTDRCVSVRHLADRPEENDNGTKGLRPEIITTFFNYQLYVQVHYRNANRDLVLKRKGTIPI